jgi:hypothetical protein
LAEILFRSRTNGPEAEHWKIGDIVAVKEDSFEWGVLETKSKWIASGRIGAEWGEGFFLLKLTNVTVAQVEYFLEEFAAGTATQGKRRLWRFDVASLTQNQLNNLIAKGEFVTGTDLTDAQAKSFIKRKDTNAAATW